MCLSPNSICCGSFFNLSPVALLLRDQYWCSYCAGDRLATFYVDRLDRHCSFGQTYACDKCAQGWLDIADKNQPNVV
ncbi:MAG: hypothetical protein AAFV28_10180 [Cyanobacteria bacterium J06635_13]